MTYGAGIRRDASAPGAAALVHRMLREGGRSTPGADYSRKVEARGGSVKNTLTADAARFCTLVPKHEVELAFWLEEGRMTEYAFNRANFDRRRSELKGEYLDSVEGSVYARGLRRLTQIAFEDDAAYERVAPPEPEDLDRLTLADARRFHRDYYHSNNAVLSVVGDFDAFSVLDQAKQHLGAAGFSGEIPDEAAPELPRQTSPRLSVLIDPSAKTSAVYYGWVVPPPGDLDHAALVLANTLLADGEGSLLYSDLVDKRHMASAVEGWMGGHATDDLFALQIQATQRARLDVIEKAVSEVLVRIAKGAPLANAALDAAKRRWLNEWLAAHSSNLGQAEYLGWRELLGAADELPGAELQRIERVTAEDVRRAVRDHLGQLRKTSVELYPKEWQDPNQAAMPTFHVVSSGENLTLIARRYGSSVEAIAKMNGINAKQPIFPGQKLRVPRGVAKRGKGSARPAKKEAIAYVVKKGDTLSGIAARHKISVAAILRANRIDPKKPLKIGQRLAIPVPP